MRTTHEATAIKPGVYFGLVENTGVLMDLPADRYFGLSDWSMKIWTQLQRGIPIAHIAEGIAEAEGIAPVTAMSALQEQLDTWRASGLLVTGSAALAAPDVPNARSAGAPATSALELDRIQRRGSTLVDLARLMRATLITAVLLRQRGLGATLRKLQAIPVETRAFPEIEARVTSLARAYVTLRRPFRQGQLDCLPRSVALAWALRRQRVDAQVCFGARTIPFTAHAWVEVDGIAVNEKLDKLQGFTVLARF